MSGLLQLPPGTSFAGDFRIVRALSEGGMGAVYVAEQISTGKQRALKIMQPTIVTDERLRQRFAQEARVGSLVDSDHVVEVVGAGVDAPSGMPWLAMELLKGETLAERSARGLAVGELREVFSQLSHALGAAHDAGIIHRDLKPENIFLAVPRRQGAVFVVKVLDFGIAKLVAEAQTRHTAAIGTPLWMAPEQTEARGTVTPAADVWALGLIAFYLLTHRFYWLGANTEGASAMTLLREVVIEPLASATERARVLGSTVTLPAGFDQWFAHCIDRNPGARFQHAREALAALDAVLAGAAAAPVVTSPGVQATQRMTPATAAWIPSQPAVDTSAASVAAPVARGRGPLILLAVGGVVVVGAIVAFARPKDPARVDDAKPSETNKVDEVDKKVGPTPRATPEPQPSSSTIEPAAASSSAPKVVSPAPVAAAPAPPASSPAGGGGCTSYKGDHAGALKAKDYGCVRGILLPKLNAGTISESEARYLKAACSALGDNACAKRAAEKIGGAAKPPTVAAPAPTGDPYE